MDTNDGWLDNERALAASLDRILRREGLTYNNAKRFSKENWETTKQEIKDREGRERLEEHISDKYKKRKERERKRCHADFLEAIKRPNFFEGVPLLDEETFLRIAEDWYKGNWRDGSAHEMVGILLKYVADRDKIAWPSQK